jgi:hypothetical protein
MGWVSKDLNFRNKPREREKILSDAVIESGAKPETTPYIPPKTTKPAGKHLLLKFNASEWAEVLELKDYWELSDYAGTIKKAIKLAKVNEADIRREAAAMRQRRMEKGIPLKWLE